MSIKDLNPFLPKEKTERQMVIQTFSQEVSIYRKKPAFWIGLIVVLACALFLIFRLDTVGRLVFLPLIFGLCAAHDTITSHFTKRLIEARQSGESSDEQATIDTGS